LKQNKAAVTLAEYVNLAPPQIKELLIHGVQEHERQRAKLIGEVVANKRNIFTKENLAMKSLEDLRGISALMHNEEKKEATLPMLFGIPAGVDAPAPTTNAATTEPLVIPKMDFSNK